MKYSLEELGLIDAPPESIFDNLTKLATSLFDIPVSLVSIVDFDNNRQYFKSQLGLVEPWAAQRQTPLSHSFCQHVVNDNSTLVVEDAAIHPKVKDNLAVRDLGVATYIGAPIYNTDDQPIGAFCVIDGKPRRWTPEEIEQLESLSNCVTDAIKLKAAYLDSERLRQEQSQFTYAISHDLISPANTLLMVLNEVALEGDKLSHDVRELVVEGQGTINRMKQQVEDVLQYSRSVEVDDSTETISIGPLVEDILLDLKGEVLASRANIICGELPEIVGNRMQIRALFLNLISNALKYRVAERDPIVKITSTHEPNRQYSIMVKDNGIGIAAKDQASIFELFTRLHVQEQYAGTGVGLALCNRVAENHGGNIFVTSDSDAGSIFTVNLPDRLS